MTRPVLRAPFLRWLPAIGAAAGAAGGVAAVTAMSHATLADLALLAGWDTVPEPVALFPLAAIVVGSVCWAAFYLVWGRGGPLDVTRPHRHGGRRITVHRQASAPWPMAIADPVVPPLPRERSLPVDLDQPLSAFDPQSIPTVSFESIRRSGLRPTT